MFEELLNLYLIVFLISFFPLLLWITAETVMKLKILFICTTKPGKTLNRNHTKYTWLFIRNYSNASDILE